MLKREIHGVFIGLHDGDSEMIEIYTMKSGRKTLWSVAHIDMLSEMKGRITREDLDNHEHEILIHFPSGKKFPILEDV